MFLIIYLFLYLNYSWGEPFALSSFKINLMETWKENAVTSKRFDRRGCTWLNTFVRVHGYMNSADQVLTRAPSSFMLT